MSDQPKPTFDEALATLKAELAAGFAPQRAFIERHLTVLTLSCVGVLLVLAAVVQITEGEGGLQILGVTCAAWYLPKLLRRFRG